MSARTIIRQTSPHDCGMVKRQVLAGRTLAARISQRRKLGTLRDNQIGPGTLKRYAVAFNRWFDFAQEQESLFISEDSFDNCLMAYVERLWEEGDPKSHGNDAFAALKHFINPLRKSLWGAKRLLEAWGKLELPNRAAPLTPLILGGICGAMTVQGDHEMADASVVAFHCLMRTGEIFKAHVKDVTWLRGKASLSLPNTKGAARSGIAESVTVEDPSVVTILKRHTEGRRPGDKLFTFSEVQFRTVFKKVLKQLELEDFNFLPYSLRRGGATLDFRHHGLMDRTVLRGRWANPRTARLYVQEGLADLASLRLTPGKERAFKALLKVYKAF